MQRRFGRLRGPRGRDAKILLASVLRTRQVPTTVTVMGGTAILLRRPGLLKDGLKK